MHSAAIAGSEAACRVLLEHGAEVNAQDQVMRGLGGMGEHGCTLTTRHVCAREHVHVYTHMVTEQRM